MKRIVIITLLLIFFLSPSVSAELYNDQLDMSGAEEFYSAIPEDAENIMDDLGISLNDSGWVNKINTKTIFDVIKNQIINGGREPLACGITLLALIIIIAAFDTFSESKNITTGYIGTIAAASAALLPVFSVITAAVGAIKAGAQFMLSFIPIYGTVLFSSGKPITAGASGGVMLSAAEGMVWLSGYVILPIVGSYLAVCISSSVSPLMELSGISDFLKKVANWTLGVVLAVYTGVLSIGTAVNSAADSLASKTGKYIIGNIPMVGGALGETLGAVQSSMALLRSSMGMFAILVLVLTLLPLLIELLLWRLSLSLSAAVASVFGNGKIASLLKATDSALSFLIGILLISASAFIISLGVLVSVGG